MVGSLELDVAVSHGNDIGDSLVVHFLVRIQERPHLPLCVLMGELLLVLGPGTDDRHILLNFPPDQGHEPSGAHFHPSFSSISDDVDLS